MRLTLSHCIYQDFLPDKSHVTWIDCMKKGNYHSVIRSNALAGYQIMCRPMFNLWGDGVIMNCLDEGSRLIIKKVTDKSINWAKRDVFLQLNFFLLVFFVFWPLFSFYISKMTWTLLFFLYLFSMVKILQPPNNCLFTQNHLVFFFGFFLFFFFYLFFALKMT